MRNCELESGVYRTHDFKSFAVCTAPRHRASQKCGLSLLSNSENFEHLKNLRKVLSAMADHKIDPALRTV